MSQTVSAPAPRLSLLVGLGAIVFLANAGLLVLQLLAGRFLAPFIGSSVETWTSVIGVFLTGIALGNHFGGRLADRNPSTRAIGVLLLLGAVASAAMVMWWMVFRESGADRALPLDLRIPILAAVFCLPPAFCLSLITPLAIKLMLADVANAGRVSGIVFAVSTLGCLLGNYVTGFWLMAEFTLNAIATGVAVGLALLAVPMLAANYRASAAVAPSASTAPARQADDPLGFRSDIRRAFALVFVASFCGMSLELTASRVLAPVLGVSLYTWTGIIGVMLAGTACGNYLGGVLADRGPKVGLERLGLLLAILTGFAAGPAVVRTFRLDAFPAQGTGEWWAIRALGAMVGAAWAYGTTRIRDAKFRQLAVYGSIGAVIGFAGAFTVARAFATVFKLQDPAMAFDAISDRINLDMAAIVIHTLGAVTGAVVAVFIMYDPVKPKSESLAPSLSNCLLFASIFTLAVVVLNGPVGVLHSKTHQLSEALRSPDVVWSVLTWTFVLFFLPMLLLGTISPQVIRLSVRDTAGAGRVAGSIYAWSTAGAILGTFATGYVLIDALGMYGVLCAVCLVLLGLASAIGRFWKNTPTLFVGSIVGGCAVAGLTYVTVYGSGFDLESKYYAIKVRDEEDPETGIKTKTMALDLLIHSYVRPEDPGWLGYQHEEIQGEFTRLYEAKGPSDVLIVGGGGYTFPRWVEHFTPGVSVEVVEIDPGVTEVAHRALGLRRDTRIRSHHMDGRQFFRERAKAGTYELVVQDAVNDLSVPYHLLTKEYNELVKASLAPGGTYLLTLIDSLEDGVLWRASVETLRQSFRYVEVLDPACFWNYPLRNRSVYVVYAADHPFDPVAMAKVPSIREHAKGRFHKKFEAVVAAAPQNWADLAMGFALRDAPFSWVLDRPTLDRLMADPERRGMVLTDQFAPVDNLMSGVFRDRSRGGR